MNNKEEKYHFQVSFWKLSHIMVLKEERNECCIAEEWEWLAEVQSAFHYESLTAY